MINNRNIWAAAPLMLKRYCDDAMRGAAQRAEDGDWQGAVTWHRIVHSIERIQATMPAEGKATY
jgi:hypothetical protein